MLRAPLELDDEGMTELSQLLRDSLDRAREINARAAERRGADATAVDPDRARDSPLRASRISSTGMAGLRRALVAIAAALALADASIVALALPPLLVEFDTTITGVAAVVGVYALVLAVAILPARRLRPGPAGLLVFAAASVGCAIANTLWLLLVFRALQAAGAAHALLTAYAVLDAGESRAGRRLWLAAALVGTAAGPAIGGVLTELFDWRAIFAFQAPIALAAALVISRPPVREEHAPPADRTALARRSRSPPRRSPRCSSCS